jgi:hypothetical protein
MGRDPDDHGETEVAPCHDLGSGAEWPSDLGLDDPLVIAGSHFNRPGRRR